MKKADRVLFNKLHGLSLKKKRTLVFLSQRAVAKALGVHQAAISRIEGGTQEMTVYEQHLFDELFRKTKDAKLIEMVNKQK